jgi:RHS repeat-associated protein
MVNAAGTYFSAEGADEYCAPYTIAQYAPVINEQEPLPGTDEDSQSPSLSASAVVPGGYPASPSFTYAFEIISGPVRSTATVEQSSGWVADNDSSWTPTTALTWGDTYYWVATVTDVASPSSSQLSSATWTTPISFVVGDAQPSVSSRLGGTYQADDGDPVMTSDLGGTDYSGSGKTLDPKTGNVSMQATDADVATVGPDLSIVRTYNSLDPRTSQAFGAGWSSVADMSLVPDSDGSGALILTLADGEQVRFAKNSAGGYAPPDGFYAVVTALSGGGFSVTDQTSTTYDFAQASGTSWLITNVTDENGMAETFSYSGTTLTTITNTTSGRALHLTWVTPSGATYPHVATVSTDPVTAGQTGTTLTWTYGYSGDLLTSVCSPVSTTQCTTYSYITNGSHAATSVLNANPASYYRLDDPTGSAAATNQVPVNDLTTVNPPATEMNTTLGVTGPVAGATATGFNGKSSWIALDGMWCTTPGSVKSCSTGVGGTGRVLGGSTSEAFSIWFKSTAAGGVLLSEDPDLPGTLPDEFSAFAYGNLLYITSNGDLGSQLCTYGAANWNFDCGTMTSKTTVNNGAWHQAVVIPGQALYLDGTEVATTKAGWPGEDDGDVEAQGPVAVAVAGTGLVPNNCTETCTANTTWSYFNGSMADLSIYQDQLPSPGTIATQYSAETTSAAELSKITSPAGRTQFATTYDTVNDRVATITDANGGTWTYGEPVDTASSGAYDAAVMGTSPEDFWPLNDTAGPDARDLVGDAATAADSRPVATYANVTLGVSGPTGFADGTAAGFTGSGSQVSIPGGYWGGTGAESAELWFDATKSTGQLLSVGTGPTGGNPISLWLSSGTLHGSIGTAALTSSTKVSTSTWYQAVLTLTPSGQATLYLDGTSVGTATLSTGTASSTGYTAYIGDGSEGDFTGSVADVSFYTSGLSSDDVTGHYSALQAASDVTSDVPSGVTAPALNTQVITITDPVGKNAVYTYSSGAVVRETDAIGGTTYYGYDSADRASTITNPDGDTTYVTYDAHNNVTSTTTCAAVNNCQTGYASYYEDLANPLDPRNDQTTDSRDPRSSSPTDPTYDTVTTYTSSGLVATTTTPPTTACPSGCATTYTYTSGTQAAVGGGTEPAGLLASVATPDGGTATYAYDSAGDLIQVTDPLGLITKYAYDNLGQELTSTQFSNTYPAGLTTSYTYDGLGRTVTKTEPGVTNRITGAVHTEVITNTYDPDSSILSTTLSDPTGGDPPRTTTYAYNGYEQLTSVTDPLGDTASDTYDALGDLVTQTSAAGVTTAFTYDADGDLLTTTLPGYTGNPSDPIAAENLVEESRAYDPAGQLASVTDVQGTTTGYTYYGNGSLASSYVADPSSSTGMEGVTSYTYDAAGNTISETQPGGLVTDVSYNADNQPVQEAADPSGADRVTTAAYDGDGDMVSESLSGGGVTQTTTATYNAMDEELSQTTDNTGANLTTTWTRDQRGLIISETDPVGNTYYVQNDEAGNPVVVTDPVVQVQSGTGGAPVTANPVAMSGYDTYGDVTDSEDPDGNITTAAYDQDGQQTSVTGPSYAAPGASTPANETTTAVYNAAGEVTQVTDPDGNTTAYTYDQLGDIAGQTDPDGGVWTNTYDPAGQQTSVTDPTGAQTQATYDNLGHLITTTDLVRQNASAAYTTSYAYNDAGEQISQTTPAGVTTTAGYDALGEQTSSTDGAGNTTTYAYNLDGDPAKTTLPDGSATATTYDLAARPVSVSDLNPAGTVLRSSTASYDADGDLTSATDFDGNTTDYTYDPTGMLTSQTQPVSANQSITVNFGYDLDGNQTALTDGNGNTAYTTYNSLGLPQVVTEPPTAQYTSAADSTTTYSYDSDGNLVSETDPGGVQINDSYDSMGDLVTQSGSGASAPTPTRTFTYDLAGRMLTADTSAVGTQGTVQYQAATSESFSYDDRGLLLASAGSAGSSAFTYNGAGQLTSDSEAAGASTYTYNSAGLLATDKDAASGTTGTYSYNNLDQVTSISYGSGNDVQDFGYDALHRLDSAAVDTGSGTQVAAIGYDYDNDNDVTSMTTSGLATQTGTGTVANTYTYDEANRLTSWTETPAGGTATTATYGYDDDGNMTDNNGLTLTYDARDEETSDGWGDTYSYSPDGDLTGADLPSGEDYTDASNAYGEQVVDGLESYTWDALDRLVTAGTLQSDLSVAYGTSLTYDGMTDEVASDSSDTYSRDPAGQVTGVDNAMGGQSVAFDDEHDDLSGTFSAAGTTMSGSTTYSPWGAVLASTGPAIQIGYQGQWTDPSDQQVDMGSRMYNAGYFGTKPGFNNQDTDPSKSGTAVTDDAYAYADDNPMSVTDPTGHSPSAASSSIGPVTSADVKAALSAAENLQKKADDAKAAAKEASAAEERASTVASNAEAAARTKNDHALSLQSQANAAQRMAQMAEGPLDGDAAAVSQAQSAVKTAQSQVAVAQRNLATAEWAAAQAQKSSTTKTECVTVITPFGVGCVEEPEPVSAPVGGSTTNSNVSTAQAALNTAQANLTTAQSNLTSAVNQQAADEATFKKWSTEEESLWKQYGVAEQAATEAQNAANSDAILYTDARHTAEDLGEDYIGDEAAATIAWRSYYKLLKEYKAELKKAASKPKPDPKGGGGSSPGGSSPGGSPGPGVCGVECQPQPTPVFPEPSHGPGCATGPDPTCNTATGDDPPTGGGEQPPGEQPPGDTGCPDPADGGDSFAADTKVLLADGKAVPISTLKSGAIVLGVDTQTGRTEEETVVAVLVHQDNDLYDLRVRTGNRITVINTTRSHLFWDASAGRWLKADALSRGAHLRVTLDATAVVIGGFIPTPRSGEMWDLTTIGDHDFFIAVGGAYVLVHNDSDVRESGPGWQRTKRAIGFALRLLHLYQDNSEGEALWQGPPSSIRGEIPPSDEEDPSDPGDSGGTLGPPFIVGGKTITLILPPDCP